MSLHEAQFNEESACDFETNQYPIRFKIDHELWAQLLDKIGFRHIILQELSLSAFHLGSNEPKSL